MHNLVTRVRPVKIKGNPVEQTHKSDGNYARLCLSSRRLPWLLQTADCACCSFCYTGKGVTRQASDQASQVKSRSQESPAFKNLVMSDEVLVMMSTTTGTSILGVEEDTLGQKWIGYKSFLRSEEDLHAQSMLLTTLNTRPKRSKKKHFWSYWTNDEGGAVFGGDNTGQRETTKKRIHRFKPDNAVRNLNPGQSTNYLTGGDLLPWEVPTHDCE